MLLDFHKWANKSRLLKSTRNTIFLGEKLLVRVRVNHTMKQPCKRKGAHNITLNNTSFALVLWNSIIYKFKCYSNVLVSNISMFEFPSEKYILDQSRQILVCTVHKHRYIVHKYAYITACNILNFYMRKGHIIIARLSNDIARLWK